MDPETEIYDDETAPGDEREFVCAAYDCEDDSPYEMDWMRCESCNARVCRDHRREPANGREMADGSPEIVFCPACFLCQAVSLGRACNEPGRAICDACGDIVCQGHAVERESSLALCLCEGLCSCEPEIERETLCRACASGAPRERERKPARIETGVKEAA